MRFRLADDGRSTRVTTKTKKTIKERKTDEKENTRIRVDEAYRTRLSQEDFFDKCPLKIDQKYFI